MWANGWRLTSITVKVQNESPQIDDRSNFDKEVEPEDPIHFESIVEGTNLNFELANSDSAKAELLQPTSEDVLHTPNSSEFSDWIPRFWLDAQLGQRVD